MLVRNRASSGAFKNKNLKNKKPAAGGRARIKKTEVFRSFLMVELLSSYSNQNIVSRLQRIVAGQDRDQPSDRTVRSPRQKQYRLNPEEISEVLQRYQAGESANALAMAFGVHRRTIVQHLTAGQVKTRYRADVDLAEARQLYEQGWSLARVGERFGVAAGTIRRALLQAGTPIRPVGTNQWS